MLARDKPLKYSVVTFGCRVNQADSLVIEGELMARGGVAVRPDEADVVVVNTCSVTATADQGARQTIRRVARVNPSVRVIVTGCYATRAPDDLTCIPNVTHIVPNSRKEALAGLIGDGMTLSTAERFDGGDGPCGSAVAPGVAGRTALTLRVQTGCEERCSYCIIPTTRGHSRSKPAVEVIRDVRRALAAGYKEIALTGVHLGSYGRDLPERLTLTVLLRHLAEWPDDVLFRVSSLEPMDCTPDVVTLVASSPRLAPHFHLPVQHGANDMLRAMRRPYTASYYSELVHRIARLMPHASIGSDVIVGFPGETESQFEESLTVLRDLPLSHLHVFPYSDRPGTEASARHPKVDGLSIRERARRVREMGAEMTRRFRSLQAGTVRRALVVDDGWSAVTDNYVKVRLEQQAERNTWVNVPL
jgi:threonylcarbamoyladenosine tRNA methylthiotransferase MtaB